MMLSKWLNDRRGKRPPQKGDRQMKCGSWYVTLELVLDGVEVRWDDLSEYTQEHIANMIKEGYIAGDIYEYGEEDEE